MMRFDAAGVAKPMRRWDVFPKDDSSPLTTGEQASAMVKIMGRWSRSVPSFSAVAEPALNTVELVARLPFPRPFTVEAFATAISEARGKAVVLVPFDRIDDLLTGAVLSTGRADYLHYRADLSGFHRDQVICHEFGHLLAGHVDQPLGSSGLESLKLLAGEAAPRMLARACVSGDPREGEAEHIGTLIMQRARDDRGPVGRGLAAALE